MIPQLVYSRHNALNQSVNQACLQFQQTGLLVITGPTGCGKTYLASLIHKLVAGGEPVFQDAAALAHSRFESQFFGHVTGAFSGAVLPYSGLLGTAGEGTLCLEGLTDLDGGIQAKMLRFLQERRYRPLGGTLEVAYPGRLMFTATDSLQTLRENRLLREDFYHRIATTELKLPAFGERPLDFPAICRGMMKAILAALPAETEALSEEALAGLELNALEGNGHGLFNALQRAIISGEKPRLEGLAAVPAADLPATGNLKEDLLQLEKRLIQRGLHRHPHARKDLARYLGISLRALMYKLKQHNLN